MKDRGRCVYGRSNGHHDAIRISPSNNHFVQERYDNGTWHDSENAFGEIVELIWQDHGGVDANRQPDTNPFRERYYYRLEMTELGEGPPSYPIYHVGPTHIIDFPTFTSAVNHLKKHSATTRLYRSRVTQLPLDIDETGRGAQWIMNAGISIRNSGMNIIWITKLTVMEYYSLGIIVIHYTDQSFSDRIFHTDI